MKLFIAEKPSVARAIVQELGKIKSYEEYTECRDDTVVTSCFGHLLEQAEPDEYLPEEGKNHWRKEDLPIFPDHWIVVPKKQKGVSTRIAAIKKLLKKSDCVINAGDPDREGQLLIDEILEYCGWRGKVLRYWASAQDSHSVQKALKSLLPNEKFKGMQLAALGRSRADWLIGINLTRACTIRRRQQGQNEVIAAGRVQSPTLNMVYKRDSEISNFKPKPYIVFEATLESEGTVFQAVWTASPNQKGLDSAKRLIDSAEAKSVYEKIRGVKQAKLKEFEKTEKQQKAPLGYSLSHIQLEASNKFGFSAQQTLQLCQNLYEKRVASYPRSDCCYLPQSQFQDAAQILKAIATGIPELVPQLRQCDITRKSEIWNDKKISAHHAIIPTGQSISNLTEDEQKIYELISRRYIAQFLPPYRFLASKMVLHIVDEIFTASGKVDLMLGWKSLYKNSNAEQENNKPIQKLPEIPINSMVPILKITPKQEKTKAPAAYTEGSLIAAMENIHSVVDNLEYKKLLKDGDGIGTPATRAAIIEELKRKGYLSVKAKKIHVTDLGKTVLREIPELVNNPVLTAIFERLLKDVETGKLPLNAFIEQQKAFIRKELENAGA